MAGGLAEVDAAIEAHLEREPDGRWRCLSCIDYSSVSRQTAKAHVESKHIASAGFMCHVCAKTCPTRHALKMHKIRNKHWPACLDIDALVRSRMYKDEAGNWRCSGCDYFSKSSTSVSEHVESKHLLGPGFACNICQHVCPTRKALKMHIFRGKHYWSFKR